MASSARASRARAQLTLKEPPASVGAKPGGVIAKLDLQFNPSTLQLGKTTEWRRSPPGWPASRRCPSSWAAVRAP